VSQRAHHPPPLALVPPQVFVRQGAVRGD